MLSNIPQTEVVSNDSDHELFKFVEVLELKNFIKCSVEVFFDDDMLNPFPQPGEFQLFDLIRRESSKW